MGIFNPDYKTITTFIPIKETTFGTLVHQLYKSLVTHYAKGVGRTRTIQMKRRNFFDVHAPGLFKEIFQTILNDDKLSSSKRCNLQRIRVVTLLHNSASLEIKYGPHFFETNTMIKLLACTTIEFNHIEG